MRQNTRQNSLQRSIANPWQTTLNDMFWLATLLLCTLIVTL
jgi:hypothetical protein